MWTSVPNFIILKTDRVSFTKIPTWGSSSSSGLRFERVTHILEEYDCYTTHITVAAMPTPSWIIRMAKSKKLRPWLLQLNCGSKS